MLNVTITHSLFLKKFLTGEVITPSDYLATSMSAKNIPNKGKKSPEYRQQHTVQTIARGKTNLLERMWVTFSTNKPSAQPSHHIQENIKYSKLGGVS
jgi:hypothetical protein